ncbi:MAG TPA: hypothetical protein VFF53_12500 [Geobacteraceae bacterium]|nr:hypothetical protein [Geobacteraceae bacterium]
MSEKVSIKIPANLAGFVRPEAADEDKLRVVRGELEATPLERATLLFFLCYDKNPQIKAAALSAMRGLPLSIVMEIVSSPSSHPRLLDLVARLHGADQQLCILLAGRGDLLPGTRDFIAGKMDAFTQVSDSVLPAEPPATESGNAAAAATGSAAEEGTEESPDDTVEEDEVPEEEQEEEFKSKYQLAQTMGVGEKIKMALTGDKEWRSILIKDSNKLVNGAVVKNPRITDPEILAISKSVIQNDEIVRVICHNKEWIKNYEIRKALVLNHKTPLPVALRFMASLSEKDLGAIGKSKNVSSVLANNARRIMMNKKKS